jgi:two-component system nitrogen regulation sensor histidine kinase NtrY
MLIFRTKILHSLLVFIVMTVIAYGISLFETYEAETMIDTSRIEEIIKQKQKQTVSILERSAEEIKSNGFDWFIDNRAQDLQNLYNEEGIGVVVYKNWYLRLWPQNTVIVPDVYGSSIFEDRFIKLGNIYYVTVLHKFDEIDLVGLIHIKSEYNSSSDLVDDHFNQDFYLSPDIKISTNPLQEPRIFDYTKEYLFSLEQKSQPIQNSAYSWVIFLFFTGALIAFFRLFLLYFTYKKFNSNYHSYIIFALVLVAIVRLLMVKYQFPHFLYDFKLFGPGIYASNWIAPSLGDLMLNTIFTLFAILFARRRLKLEDYIKRENKNTYFVFLGVFIVVTTLFAVQLNNLLSTIIRDSTIEFQPYKVFNINGFSILAFLTILTNIVGFLLFFDYGFTWLKKHVEWKILLWVSNIILASALLVGVLLIPEFSWISIVYFLLLINLIFYYRKRNKIKFSFVIIFAAATGIYLTHIIDIQNQERQFGRMKLLAVNLAVSQDFYAESRFQQISEQLPADPYVDTLLSESAYNPDELLQYIKRKYFSNYLSRYDVQLEVCHDSDSIFVEESTVQWQHCRQYHHNKALEKGDPVFKSNYFYMGEEDSRMQYMGMHDFLISAGDYVTLIINLKAKVLNYNPGFTQLLERYDDQASSLIGNYSYAKYRKGRLESKFGEYPYSLVAEPYMEGSGEFRRVCSPYHCHLVFEYTPDDIVVVSFPSLAFFQLLINFSYLFVFIFILLTVVALYYTYKRRGIVIANSIRNRIQFSMVGILLVSIIFIGGGSVLYISQAYEKKNMQIVNEKLHSVLTELENQFGGHKSMFQVDEDYLKFLMQKYSEVYNSDINVFDIDGNLLSSSRPEVFKQEFLSRKMEYNAYNALRYEHKYQVIQQEKIGQLTYYSAYVPLINKQNSMLGFVNLPFFSNEDLLTEDISSIIVTFINVYVLLILLSIIIAVFISNNVTRPLQLLRQKMRQIDLKKHNNPIDMDTDDEIGDLVKEYNHMVSELSRSADLLAKQERETAWRSMARQVAHEIKNPLTPMKLSVQLMLRAWDEKAPDFEERLKRVSNTLIHQIDTLSNIATEFSTFARMPSEQIEKVDINAVVRSASTLYDEYKDVDVIANINEAIILNVLADKSRMLRMLNNLIKNAAQAIPKGKKGNIWITTQQVGDKVLIMVKDNGDGIPMEIREKLFQPNFTTKTKGMGLGLAMVKNIVEGFGGKIWFETATGQGTTFYIQLPLV